MLEAQRRVGLLEEFPFLPGMSVFFYSVDRRRPSHITKDNLLYLKTTDVNANVI